MDLNPFEPHSAWHIDCFFRYRFFFGSGYWFKTTALNGYFYGNRFMAYYTFILSNKLAAMYIFIATTLLIKKRNDASNRMYVVILIKNIIKAFLVHHLRFEYPIVARETYWIVRLKRNISYPNFCHQQSLTLRLNKAKTVLIENYYLYLIVIYWCDKVTFL